ncbi:MAG TPA: MBL fold metallo-hydrolase [Candidatus Collinsella stercoripullorum]|nr:MBL fold metallo-hydrolase [Candidatus Collinsella stercoripullorum]
MTDPVLDLAPCGSISIDCVVNGPISTNTYFVVSGDEALIIDPAWEGDKLAERLRAAHPGARPVGIVCTHGHGDHVGGVAGMRRALGDDVPYLISASDAGFVRDAVASMRVRWGIDTEMPPAPDRLLSEGDTVAVGDAVLQVIDAPGHTPGGIVLFCASAEGRVAFMGDTLFPGGHGRTDLVGGDEDTILHTLGRLFRSLPEDTLCLIGHDGTTTVSDELERNPFVAHALSLGL